ncbi:DUF6493 family protein, partial [Streptomyces sp. NRRL S-813]|uniref:DUF6493 family protein n=1 Tax=Streptomyces sp. NRRL S-813 TaxID=1463919 RepID=UPI0004BFE781
MRALALTPSEYTPFLRDHVAMLDLSLPVAAYGQEVLIALDEAGLLEDDVRTEASERVLLRPEKKLVRAQLSWLGRVVRRDPSRAGRALADAAITFQHPDMALQESALKLVARHLKRAGSSVLPELRTAAGQLSPGLTARAAELFGPLLDPVAGRSVEVLPAVPEPQPVPGPVKTVAEAAQEVAVTLANRDDVVAFERALDGLVRHARLDRAALSKALKPVKRTRSIRCACQPFDLHDVATVVRGEQPRKNLGWHHDPPWSMTMARLTEAMDLVESGAQPFLLAVPTLATGALDAAVLVERIAELESLGVTPAQADFAQALLRVTPTADEQVQRAAGALRSDAGRRLARWLREGGLPHRDSTPEGWPVSDPVSAPPGRWEPAQPEPGDDLRLPPLAAALVGPYRMVPRCGCTPSPYAGRFWAAQMPHHREEVAARLHTEEPHMF